MAFDFQGTGPKSSLEMSTLWKHEIAQNNETTNGPS